MATAEYTKWVNAGRPYAVATCIQDFVGYAKAAGVPWLGTLGSDDSRHLQASNPQDHTPFSRTAWPVPLPGYVVTACDLGRGKWCDKFLAECKAGLHPWVKYINFGGHHYDVRKNWMQEYSSDEHFHVSARTDRLNDHPRNPFVEVDEMAGFGFTKEDYADAVAWRLDALTYGLETVRGGPSKGEEMQVVKMLNAVDAKLNAVTALLEKTAVPGVVVDLAVLEQALRNVLKDGVDNG